MTDGAVQLMAGGTLAVVILRQVFDFVVKAKNGKGGNGTSGEKPPEYWMKAFEDIVEEVMNRRNIVLKDMMRREIEDALNRKFRTRGL